MEEAYVIGIRLALEDGISAGLAAIQGELATLDIAIATTAAHLVQLQSMAAVTNLQRLATVGEQLLAPTPQPAPGPVPHPVEPTTNLRPAPILLPPAQSPSSPLPLWEGPGEGLRRQDVPPPTTPQSAAVAPLSPAVPSREKLVVTSPMSEPPSALAAPQAALPVPPSRAEPARAPVITILSPPPAAPVIVTRNSPPIPNAPLTPPHPGREHPHKARGADHPSPAAPLPPWEGPSEARHAHHPPVAPSVAPHPQSPIAPAAPYAALPPPPQQQAQNNPPTGGDVFLDGHHVGHWIADHLARESARPSAGTAAFDPRLTPSYPGALQGN